ncbi:MAG TPA: MFS transporter [Solirubrobacterales bacterium]|jgi:MFS family permease
MRSALRPLALPVFRRLAAARFIDELGDWLGEIALAVLVFDQTGSPMAVAALFVALQFVPAIATPPLVARLEALPTRGVLAALNAVQALVFSALALLAPHFALLPVIVLAAIGGGLAVSGRALSRAAAAVTTEPHGLLREGNAVLNVAFTVGAAGGPALAGLVVASAGVRTALFADAASFALVAVLMATAARIPRAAVEEVGSLERMRRVFTYVRENPLLRTLIAAQAAAFIFFALVIPIEVVFAKETLDAGDVGYGVLLASWGAGMVAGSIAFALLRDISLRVLLPTSTLAIGAAYLLTGLSPTLLVACLASIVGGIGNGIEWVTLVTAMQQLTSSQYQARVMSLVDSVARAAPGVGFVLGGAIAAMFSPRASYAVAGVGVIAVLAIAFAALSRAGWRGEPVAAPEPEPFAPEPVPLEGARPADGPIPGSGRFKREVETPEAPETVETSDAPR